MSADDDELEARLTLIETAIALLFREEGLDQLRAVVRATGETVRHEHPTSLSDLEERPALLRRLQHMEDRLDILDGFVRRHRSASEPHE